MVSSMKCIISAPRWNSSTLAKWIWRTGRPFFDDRALQRQLLDIIGSALERCRLWERLDALREAGGAVVFASQHLEEIERHAGRVVALRDGRLVFAGTVDEYDRLEADTLSA